MIGGFGCPCSTCQGTGTIHMQLRSKLCAIERLLGVEVVVTMGYRCEGMGDKEMLHSTMNGEEGCAMAVDFFPRNRAYDIDRVPVGDGKKWGTRRYDFLELVRPYFDRVWIMVDAEDHNKWSIHGEIEGEKEI